MREKQQVTHKGIHVRLTANLSAEILQVRWEWQGIFKVTKGKNTTKVTLSSKDLIQNQ